LKILQNCRNRLVDTAQSVEEEVEERSEEDLISVSNDIQYEQRLLPENRNLLKAMVSIGPLGPGASTGGVPKTYPGSGSYYQLGSSL
jgi:hypothetical protein